MAQPWFLVFMCEDTNDCCQSLFGIHTAETCSTKKEEGKTRYSAKLDKL